MPSPWQANDPLMIILYKSKTVKGHSISKHWSCYYCSKELKRCRETARRSVLFGNVLKHKKATTSLSRSRYKFIHHVYILRSWYRCCDTPSL